ncbi:hypothetical protein BRAFLDRAFT_78148, partial [Paramuricea clavata]
MTFPHVLVVICLLTIINVKPIKTSNSTKCHRLCVCLNSTTLDCSNKNLTSVPNDLPGDTTILFLNNNQIERLLPLTFDHLPNLTKVDLSGNKINCDCSLIWTKYANFTIQLMATCQNPTWVRGRSLANITMEDMCKIPSTPVVAKTTVQSTVPTATTPQHTTTTATTPSTEQAGTANVVPTTTVEPQTSRRTPQMTTVEPQTSRRTPQMTTVEPQTSTNKPATTLAERQVTTKDSASLPTHRPNVTSTSVPTRQENVTDPYNLTSLVDMSSKELNAESLRNLIEMLESDVDRRNYSDTATTM